MRDQAKKQRQNKERKKRGLRALLPKTLVAIKNEVGQDLLVQWIQNTRSFPEFLHKIADDWFDDKANSDTHWINGMCCMITDLAEAEKVKESLETPRELFLWLAKHISKNLSENELLWDDSKIFSPENIEKVFTQLEDLKILVSEKET